MTAAKCVELRWKQLNDYLKIFFFNYILEPRPRYFRQKEVFWVMTLYALDRLKQCVRAGILNDRTGHVFIGRVCCPTCVRSLQWCNNIENYHLHCRRIDIVLLEITAFTVGAFTFHLRSLKSSCFYFCNWLRPPFWGEGRLWGFVGFAFFTFNLKHSFNIWIVWNKNKRSPNMSREYF